MRRNRPTCCASCTLLYCCHLRMSEQDDGHEPLRKRQKRGEEAAPEIIAFGGPMYDETTARKMLKEVRFNDGIDIDDDDGEQFQGFDPDDAALDNFYYKDDSRNVSPMIHFAAEGNAKMCRYLISRGASTTKADEGDFYFPLYAAASRGHLEVCKLLYENGAQNGVRKMIADHWTPFKVAANLGRTQIIRWLVLHGALCADNKSEDVEAERIHLAGSRNVSAPWESRVRRNVLRSCNDLVAWAKEVTQTHSAVVTFLGGTLPPAPASTDADQRCILKCLSGHPGVRKHIFDFVGLEVTKGKHLRILRSVVEVLPSFIERSRGRGMQGILSVGFGGSKFK